MCGCMRLGGWDAVNAVGVSKGDVRRTRIAVFRFTKLFAGRSCPVNLNVARRVNVIDNVVVGTVKVDKEKRAVVLAKVDSWFAVGVCPGRLVLSEAANVGLGETV